MGEDSDDISKIKELLKVEPRGLSIRQITDHLGINRNLAAKYLDMLLISGQVEMRTIGMAKMYYLSHRVPITAMMDFSSEFIVVLDENLKIIQINDHFLEFLHLSRDDILGRILGSSPVTLLSENEIILAARDSLRGKEIAQDLKWSSKDGEQYYHGKFIPTVFENGSPGVTIILEDTTEIKRAENSLRTALREKEVLLGEINQRINDNLQLIISLIELQAGSIQDDPAKEILRETQNRIMTLAIVYSQMGTGQPGTALDLDTYIHNLTRALFEAYTVEAGSINSQIEARGVKIPADKAAPLGLVMNEIIGYTLRTAFPKDLKGTIRIEGSGAENSGYTIRVSHDGKGFPETTDISNADELGLQLAWTLVTKQLGGTISINPDTLDGFELRLPGDEKQ